MQAVLKYTHTPPELLAATKTWNTQKVGLNSKIHLAVDANGLPIRILVTADTVADCTQACTLIDGFSASFLFADRGYDSNRTIEKDLSQNMNVVIPPNSAMCQQAKNSVLNSISPLWSAWC